MKSLVKREYNNQGKLIKKQCTECKRMLPVEEYQKASKVKDGYRSKCKSCANKYYMNRSKYNKDKVINEVESYEPATDKEVYGIIYVVFNLYSRKHYIGQTTRTFNERYPNGWLEEHAYKEKVSKDLNKYGKDSFIYIKLYDIAYNKEHLDALESYYMDKFDSINNGYNHRRGNGTVEV